MSQMLHNASLFGRLTLIMGFVPLVMAVVYALRPTEQNLSLMRPLSLAGLFAAIAGMLLGFINVLKAFWTREPTSETYRVMAVGAAESLVPVLLGFACLTVAWLVVAIMLITSPFLAHATVRAIWIREQGGAERATADPAGNGEQR